MATVTVTFTDRDDGALERNVLADAPIDMTAGPEVWTKAEAAAACLILAVATRSEGL